MAYTGTNEMLKVISLINEKLFTGYGFLHSLEINYINKEKKWNVKIYTGINTEAEFMFDLLISDILFSSGESNGTYKIYNLKKDNEVINSGKIQFGPIFKFSNIQSLLIEPSNVSTINQSFYYKDDDGIKELTDDNDLRKSMHKKQNKK